VGKFLPRNQLLVFSSLAKRKHILKKDTFRFSSCTEGFVQGLSLHISEIEELCSEFPSTIVLLDHMAFCKPPM